MTSHTIRVTSYSVGMLSQQLFRTLHTSMYNFTPSIFMTSYPICTVWPYRFHENTMTLPAISPAIFDITATVSMSSPRWHTHLYRHIALLMTSKQVQRPYNGSMWPLSSLLRCKLFFSLVLRIYYWLICCCSVPKLCLTLCHPHGL